MERVPNAHGLFWKIEKSGIAPSWLLGTMHIPDEVTTNFRPAVIDAFERAGVVVLEIEDVSDEGKQALAEKVLAVAQLPEGESFDRTFTKEQTDTLGDMTAAIGMPYFAARRMQPWLLAISLAMPPCVHVAMLRGEEGVDEKLQRLAVEGGKRVVGLETVDEQVMALASLEEVVGPDELLELVSLGPGAIADLFATQVQSYIDEQPSLAVALMLNMPEFGSSAEVFRAVEGTLIRDRNLRMRDRLLPILEEGGVFVGVGALTSAGRDRPGRAHSQCRLQRHAHGMNAPVHRFLNAAGLQ